MSTSAMSTHFVKYLQGCWLNLSNVFTFRYSYMFQKKNKDKPNNKQAKNQTKK